MLVSKENIGSLIPQGPPMVMIDALVGSDELITCTTLVVRADNIFVENGKLCEPGLLENIAQTAAARAGYIAREENKPVPMGYIGAVKDFEIMELPETGDTLETEISIQNTVFNVSLISGKIRRNGVLLAQCEMKIFIV